MISTRCTVRNKCATEQRLEALYMDSHGGMQPPPLPLGPKNSHPEVGQVREVRPERKCHFLPLSPPSMPATSPLRARGEGPRVGTQRARTVLWPRLFVPVSSGRAMLLPTQALPLSGTLPRAREAVLKPTCRYCAICFPFRYESHCLLAA